jgi:hypothetical protein
MNSGLVEIAIRRHVDPRANLLIPEAAVRYQSGVWTQPWDDGSTVPMYSDYRADFMMVTGAGYATEIEVKVSLSDWRVDLKKPKWQAMPAWVTRFVYAVPEALGVPEWVPSQAGVWHIKPSNNDWAGLQIAVVRAPKRIGAQKVPDDVMSKWMKNFYYRYWDMRRHKDHVITKAVA